MDLIDEKNNVLCLRDLLDNILHTLFKLTAVLGTGDERCERECYDTLILQHIRDAAFSNALGKPFRNGGLTDTRLAEEDRIVLRAARENLDNARDLRLPPNDGIHAASLGKLCKVSAKLGDITRTFRTVSTGTLAPFAADIAIFRAITFAIPRIRTRNLIKEGIAVDAKRC